MTPLRWMLLLGAGFALATAVAGWWAVPLVGLVAGYLLPAAARPLLVVPAGAGLGWAVLLLRAALAEGFTTLAGQLGNLLALSPLALATATLLFPVVTAGAAALVGDALARRGPAR